MKIPSGSGTKSFDIEVVEVLSGKQIGVLVCAEVDHLFNKFFGKKRCREVNLSFRVTFEVRSIFFS